MSLKEKKIGFVLTGSFCTFATIFEVLEQVVATGAEVYPIFSNAAQSIDSRFGTAQDFIKRATDITGNTPILTIAQAEPIGPKGWLDLVVIAPCTGNTIAKLANGITDTPALMAAKGHLRNGKPVVLAISTNDALGMNMKNIGLLLNAKNIYFVPFGQDDPMKKPNSLVAHMNELIPTLEKALQKEQYQPMIQSFPYKV